MFDTQELTTMKVDVERLKEKVETLNFKIDSTHDQLYHIHESLNAIKVKIDAINRLRWIITGMVVTIGFILTQIYWYIDTFGII